MAELGLAPATVLQAHRLLSRALKIAMQRGRVGRNVCTLVDAPSLVHHEIQPLTVAGARKILATATTRRDGARWAGALALGLRQGEALGLQWSEIDLEAPSLTVRRALQCQRGRGLVRVEPKSRAGQRTIALPEPIVELLRGHRLAQNGERAHARDEWQDLDFVCAQPTGAPIDSRADRRDWDQLLKDSDVRPARLHDARHTAATTLLIIGVPARVVMQILGTPRSGSPSAPTATSSPDSPPTPPTRSPRHTGGSALAGERGWSVANSSTATTMAPLILCLQSETCIFAGQTGCAARDLNPEPAD